MSDIAFAREVPAALVPPGKRPDAWSDERVEKLKGLASAHESCANIAAELNSLPGPGITRSAVIGKLHRLGLSTGNGKGDHRGPRRERKSKDNLTRKTRLDELFDADEATELPPEQSEHAMTFVEAMATDNRCRYPIGNPLDLDAFRFCGAPKKNGCSYCAPHFRFTHKRAYATPQLAESERQRRIALGKKNARKATELRV